MKKTNRIPYYVFVHSSSNGTELEKYDVMEKFINSYRSCKIRKPKTFNEFKTFVKEEGRYYFHAACEWESLVGHWPFGGYNFYQKVKKFLSEGRNLDSTDDKIALANAVTTNMVKIDAWYQIELNIDTVTRILMANVLPGKSEITPEVSETAPEVLNTVSKAESKSESIREYYVTFQTHNGGLESRVIRLDEDETLVTDRTFYNHVRQSGDVDLLDHVVSWSKVEYPKILVDEILEKNR